ncbi:MAG: protein kinase [Gemmatimonadota bacterium]|nr:MAG: protein kinase [Gemmatimonadota bacterium]
MIGKTISHYKILEKIGEGGMGVVYKAEDTKLKRTVALKFLPPELNKDSAAKERFLNEARAAAALNHPNICTIHEIEETDGQTFIVMEYIEGQSLHDIVGARRAMPLSVDEAIDYTTQIAQGLQAAHEKGIIHRDIKPANIMVTEKGQVKITDFGLARLTGRTKLTTEGTVMGTVTYMSPEQARGKEVDQQSDIWSLGVVLYELLTGKVPFKADSDQAVIYSIINETPETITDLNTGVPQELEWIILRAMEKEKEDRYQNVSELLDDLKKVKQASITTGAIQPPESLQRKRKKQRLMKTMVPTGLIVLIAMAFFIFRPLLFDQSQEAERIPIAVISFENQTGDPTYDYLQKVIPNLLITKLEQSPQFMVNTWERMRDLAKQLNKGDVEVIDSELGFELCRMDDVNTIVLGSFAKAGEMFITDVKVLDVNSKKLLKSASLKGRGEESILGEHIDELGLEISRGMGLSDSKTGEIQRPIVDLTTNSLEAYYNFLRGRDNVEMTYYNDARHFLEKAVEIDSTFAMAYLYLAWTHSLQGNTKASVEAYEKANALSERTTDKEKLFIEALYSGYIEGDTEKQIRILRQIEKKYPKEKRVYYYLSNVYLNNGPLNKAIEEGNKALELDPDYGIAICFVAYAYAGMEYFEEAIKYFERYASISPGDANPYDCIGEMYWKMGRFDEAIEKYKEAIEIKSDFYPPYRSIGYIYALKENYQEATNWIGDYIDIVQQPVLKDDGYAWKGVYEYLYGRFSSSLQSLETAMKLAKKEENTILIYQIGLLTGWMYFDRDQTDLAYSYFNNAFEEHRLEYPESVNREVAKCLSLGQIYVKQGQVDSAMTKLSKLELYMSEVTPQAKDRAIYQHNIFKSELLLAQNLVDESIAVLEEASPLVPPTAILSKYLIYQNIPFCVDILARAYFEKGE